MSELYTGNNLPFVVQHDSIEPFMQAQLDWDHIAHFMPRDLAGDFVSLSKTLSGVGKSFTTAEKFTNFLQKYKFTPSEQVAIQNIINDILFAEELLAKGEIVNVEFRVIEKYVGRLEEVYNFHHDNTCRILCSYVNPNIEWLDPSDTDLHPNPRKFDEYIAHQNAPIYHFPSGTLIRCNKKFIHRAPTEINSIITPPARFLLTLDYPE